VWLLGALASSKVCAKLIPSIGDTGSRLCRLMHVRDDGSFVR